MPGPSCIVRRLAQATDKNEPRAAAGPRPPRFFFGWVIVGFAFTAQFLTMGTLFYAFGPLLKPLTEALDADRFQVSLALSLQSAVVAVIGPWVGRQVAERSIRALMIGGAVMLLFGFLFLGQVRSLWQLYLSYGLLLGAAMAMAGPIPSNTLLTNWFSRRRGTAIGIAGTGISISGTAVIPLVTWLVLEYGWRTAVTSLGVAAFAILATMAWFFAVKRPEDRGMLPDNAAPGPDPGVQAPVEDPGDAHHWTLLRAVRNRRVWHLILIVGSSFLAIGGVLLALHSHMTDLGLSPLQAASIMAVLTFCAALAKPLFGVLADHINLRLSIAVSLGCQIVGLSLIMAFENPFGLTFAGMVFGLGYGAVMPLWTVLLGSVFGRASFARIMGVMSPLTTPFILVGMPFTTLVYESTGSYLPAFGVLVAGFVVSTGALALLRLPGEKGHKALTAAA